jgi:transcriptional regulator with AAA-type ATPase domain/tetratricopeptide (TPR) repeat protein
MDPLAELVGESAAFDAVRAQIRRLLARQEKGRRLPSILITGETGSGKGLVARTIHRAGPRADGPFVDVNCAAIPETLLEAELFGFERGAFTDARRSKAGLFQTANRGTIFLDEVGLLPEALQAKLLKVLEDQVVRRLGATASEPLDVWIISATNADLQAAVRRRAFREDLYHRLAVLTLMLPPLRQRGRDVLILAEGFLARVCADYGLPAKRFASDAQTRLLTYPWPGNIRELGNVIERVALLAGGDLVTADMLDLQPGSLGGPTAAPTGPGAVTLDDAMGDHVRAALTQTNWNISRTAAVLGISRNTLRARIAKLGLRAGSEPAMPMQRAKRPPAPAVSTTPAKLAPAGPLPVRWEQRRVSFVRATLVAREGEEGLSEAARGLETLIDKARSFGGRIEELSAKGIGVVFGLEPTEDAPLRAAHASMAMQKAVERAREDSGESFALRIAIHVGNVLVGRAGPEAEIDGDAKRAEWQAIDALLSVAQPGTTVISPSASVFLQGRFLLEPLGDAQGGDKVGYTLSRLERPRGGPAGAVTTFVGRGPELEFLRSRLESTRGGNGQMVGIVGEAGMGKSRLLEEFRHSLRGEAVTYLEGHCLSFGSSIPYLPALEILRQAGRLREAETPEAVARKVGALLARLAMSDGGSLPYLLHFLGIKAGAESLAMTGPDALQSRTFDILRRLCAQSARERPLVIAIEDIHWIDSASEALGATIEGLARIPLLLIVTYRPGHRPAWLEKPRVTQIALQPLSPGDSLTIVKAAAPGHRVPSPVAEAAILAKAEGNPFFLKELTRVVVEGGESGAVGAGVPETIQEVLLARVNRLPDDAKALLQTASILGREASRGLLAALWREPVGLGPPLDELVRLELLYERPAGDEPVYVFKHALIQEVAYTSILDGKRKTEHRALGRVLEERYAGRSHEVVELLAHHFGLADDHDKAVEYALLAADKAHRSWANAEALAHFDSVLRRLAAMPDSPTTRLWRVDAVLKQGEVRFALGQHAEHLQSLEAIRRLVEEAADLPRRAAWCYWSGFLHSLTGSRPEVSIAYCREAVAIADTRGLDEIRAYAESCLAHTYEVAGQLREAVAAGERALAIFEPRGNIWWACRTLWILNTAALYLGEWKQSLGYCARAMELGRIAKDRRLQAVSAWRTGATHLLRGDPTAGLRCFEEAVALSPSPLDTAMIKMARGYGFVKAGDARTGTALLTEALEWFDRSQLHFTRTMTALRLGEGLLALGDRERARALAAELREASLERGYRYFEAMAERLLGECLAHDDPAAASPHLDLAMRLFEEIGARNDLAKTLVNRAELERRAGNRAAERELLQRALGIFEELGTLDEPLKVRTALATL